MIIKIITSFANDITDYDQLKYQCIDERGEKLSSETVSDWLTYRRKIELEALVLHTHMKIGGPN